VVFVVDFNDLLLLVVVVLVGFFMVLVFIVVLLWFVVVLVLFVCMLVWVLLIGAADAAPEIIIDPSNINVKNRNSLVNLN
jgi:hypothetical protein